ncbi:hypothetical protein [Cellulomonas sp.]|uniref:hypothetical protein n=1 Tax=Cellulomonas sp. TaxID=40001 RepID=UPI001B08022B|nr:hypothetical protein [Cellulomonas sp.]MBO9554721.1 hypothetical protein [Cellulomonas sp.]
MTSGRSVLRGIGVVALFGALCACTPAEVRGEHRIIGWSVAGDVLHLWIDTCNGDPASEVVETDDDVTVTIVSTRRNPGDACQDVVEVALSEPLGDRTLVDGATGREPAPMEG